MALFIKGGFGALWLKKERPGNARPLHARLF
jgi:hypothetical protein